MDKITEYIKSFKLPEFKLPEFKRPELRAPSAAISVTRKVDQSQYTDTMPSYPGRTLVVHVATRGLQLGSIVGLILTPLLAWRRKSALATVWRGFVPKAAIVGSVVSSSIVYYKDTTGALDIAGVDDRAYRIAHNEGQVKVDRYSLIGGAAGAVTGVIVGGAMLPLACTGVALGVAAYGAEKKYKTSKDSEVV
jgi:hypothetical protein